MAPPRLQYSTAFDATYSDKASGGDTTLVTTSIRDGDDQDGQTGTDVEVWGQAPVLYVPADPDDGGSCQALTTEIGGVPLCLATRDLRAVDAMPALPRGGAAFVCPTGRGGFFSNPDGSMGMLQRGVSGAKDALLVFEPDGTFNLSTPWGQMVLGPDGWQVILANGQCIAIGADAFTVTGTQASIATSSVALGATAAAPLAAVSGGVVPVNNVFV